MVRMSDEVEALLAESLRLPAKARAALASRLLESLEAEELEENEDAEWAAELARRVEDVESGRVKGVPWEEVEARLAAMIAKSRGR